MRIKWLDALLDACAGILRMLIYCIDLFPSFFFSSVMLVFLTITCSLILACHGAPVSFLNRLQTLFSFGDSYTTQNLDTITMSYACANCTSAGGPNWVEYLVEIHPMQYWNLAYNSAPISNNLVDQVCNACVCVCVIETHEH